MPSLAGTQALTNFYFKRSGSDCALLYCRNVKCISKREIKQKGYKQKPGKGYTNLRKHLRVCIGEDYEQRYIDYLNKAGDRLDNYCYTNARDSDVFRILEWIILRNQPLLAIDDRLTRSLFNIKSVSPKSLGTYIFPLTTLVENAISKHLPGRFCIMFDGWTDAKTHCVAIFATYIIKGEYSKTMLACASLFQYDDFRAAQNKAFVEKTLHIYCKDESNIVCGVGDNSSVN